MTYGHNNVVKVMLPPKFTGQIQIYFYGKWYWRIATLISVFTLIYLYIVEFGKKKAIKMKYI